MSEHRSRRSYHRLGWLVAALALATVACNTQGLVLEQPDQLRDLEPSPLSTTKAPVTVSWSARPLADGERYLVLVDRQPMAPGSSLLSLVDDVCKATPACPDKAYLLQNFMFTTRGDHVEVAALPVGGPFPVNDFYDLHSATIVILDPHDRRVGEEFWSTSFYVAAA